MARIYEADAIYEAKVIERFEQGEMDFWEAEDTAVVERINAAMCKVVDMLVAELGIEIINPLV